MAVTRFMGKIYYPLMAGRDAAGALASAVTVTNKGKEALVFCKSRVHCEEMRTGLGGILGDTDGPARIAEVYALERREVIGWPKNNKGLAFCPRTGPEVPIALTGLRFLLFESGVVLLEMSLEMAGLALEDAMNATYFLCEVKDERNHFAWEERIFDPETRTARTEPRAFSLREWFLRCTAFLPGCENFEDRPLESTVSKPLLYGFYWLSEKPADFERLAANLAQNFKASYKGVEDGRFHLLQAFENSYWCASYNAAVNVSYAVEDAASNQFFETAFPHKWESEYLFLFLNTVHQKYAVLKYLAELGELACTQYDYTRMRELLIQSEVMRERCGLLKNRCFFELPSHVEHVNRVYGFFQWCFDIPGYLASLNAGVEGSIEVCSSYVNRIKEIEDLEEALRGARNERYIALITASITCLTFFGTAYETLQSLLTGQFGAVGVSGAVVTGTFVATISGVVYNVTHQRTVMNDLKEKIDFLKSKSTAL